MIRDIVAPRQTQLFLAEHKIIYKSNFSEGLGDFVNADGLWHKVTVDTNLDVSSGLTGGLAIDAMGCYRGGSTDITFNLNTFGEFTFDYYLQNDLKTNPNLLTVAINNDNKLSMEGPRPWTSHPPIVLNRGTNEVEFAYDPTAYTDPDNIPDGKKVIVDNFIATEAKELPLLIQTTDLIKPKNEVTSNKTLRGETIYQRSKKDTMAVNITIIADAVDLNELMINIHRIFYFKDEFNFIYRGVIVDEPSIQRIAYSKYYTVKIQFHSNSFYGGDWNVWGGY